MYIMLSDHISGFNKSFKAQEERMKFKFKNKTGGTTKVLLFKKAAFVILQLSATTAVATKALYYIA